MRFHPRSAVPILAMLVMSGGIAQGNDQTILYGVQKNKMPQGMVVEQGQGAPGIPTDGTQQGEKLRRNNPATGQPRNYGNQYGNQYGQPYGQAYGQPYAPGYNRGPNVIYRDPKDKGLTVITGPDGTTVCRDASGRVTVCY